jgi:hypothetical protein
VLIQLSAQRGDTENTPLRLKLSAWTPGSHMM